MDKEAHTEARPEDYVNGSQEQTESAQSDLIQAKENIRKLKQDLKETKKKQKLLRQQQKIEDKQKYPLPRLRGKARRLRWKKEKADRRNELKNRYRDAPWLIRVARLYLLKPAAVLVAVAVLVAILDGFAGAAIGAVLNTYFGSKNNPVSVEEIYKQSPIDESGVEKINAAAPVDEDDTWTICVYLIGSNLEDWDENDLSDAIMLQIMDARQQINQEKRSEYQENLSSLTEELEKKNLEIPAYLFYPDKPVRSDDDTQTQSGPVIADSPGCASTDIGEMTSDIWSDNIRIVIQTGGAMRWSNWEVNPNRTQRFLYHNGVFTEVDSLPMQQAADPATLTSFLNFCKTNYPADHNMLILWDHGSGAFGYGHDSIFGNSMTLKDIREALEGAYKPNQKNPAFDIIGFDACLMSSLEVTHALNGFASYYAVSAETEPGDGWNYGPWLKAMTEDPTLSPAKVAQNIADSYMDFYVTQNINVGKLITSDVTFSVLNAAKAENLYEAWCDLAKQQLIDAASDSGVLAEIGRCSSKSTHYVSSAYDLFNTIDLGNYADLMSENYPDECARIKELLGETVMYCRTCGALSDSQGISVYVPGTVGDFYGLAYCLDYVYNICEDPSTKALYYYKVAGCLNDDMEEYLATLTDVKAHTLDLKPFLQFGKAEPVITDYGFEIPIEDNLMDMLQTYETELAAYDEKTGRITNYGRDETARLDGEGNMNCEFDGTWICYDGVPLATEVVASTSSSVEYRSRVLYNGNDSYLCFTWDRDAEEFTVNGIRNATELSGILNSDPVNYLINTRMNIEVNPGDVIVPLYEIIEYNEDYSSADMKVSKGEKIKVSNNSEITLAELPAGYYISAIAISDQRGDVYYSGVVGNVVSGGKVSSRDVDTGFIGSDY